MGVEHYIVCGQCKEYIDLHKAYAFAAVVRSHRPPVGIECEETGFNEAVLYGNYWESRGLWFVWKHRGHNEIELHTDADEDWYDLEPKLTEKFSHEDDLNIRKLKESQ